MSEVITLSSDEEELREEQSPARKRIKPTHLHEVTLTPLKVNKPKAVHDPSDDVVILSDEDDYVLEKGTSQSNELSKENEGHTETEKDDDTDSITFIDEKNDTNNIAGGSSQNGYKDGTESLMENSIILDENSSEESSGKENKFLSKKNLSPNNLSEPSTSGNSSDTLLENFLSICEESINNSPYEHLKDKQFPIMRMYYHNFGSKLSDSSNFRTLIEENKQRCQKSAATAVISFNEVFQYIKGIVDAESVDVPEENRIRLKKLEKTIKLLLAKIKHLESSEIDFEDEEDSTYLQLDRYTNRLNKVYGKYCELLKKNPYSGRITYERLDFVESEYNEINRAICKKYKNNKKFPSYIEMEEFIKKIDKEHNLSLSDVTIKSESLRCFKKLGELLQSRRKKELYDTHYFYIRDSEDPACKDPNLDSTLKQAFVESQKKIEKICEEYVVKQEKGEEVEEEEAMPSEDESDKSNYVDSENDEQQGEH